MIVIRTVVAIMIGLFLVSCTATDRAPGQPPITDLLPKTFENLALERSGPVELFRGESLSEHINGAAGLFHQFDFVEMATAVYVEFRVEVNAEIYRFATPSDAFGYFSTIRPANPYRVPIGVDAFTSNLDLHFLKGPYYIKLVVYTDEKPHRYGMRLLAVKLNEIVPGDTTLPPEFDLFPDRDRVEREAYYYTDNFLELEFMSEVYSQNYNKGRGNFITLFLSDDLTGEKYEKLLQLSSDWDQKTLSQQLPFDSGRVICFDSGEYGWILAGLIKGRLVGLVGYEKKLEPFIDEWLSAL